MFDAVDGQYRKVAAGRGILDLPEIEEVIEKCTDLFNR